MRITRKRWKAVYLVGGLSILLVLAGALEGLPDDLDFSIGNLLSLGFLLTAIRTFRGRDEAVEPPRAWWRATARPTAGFVLGAFFALSSLLTFAPEVYGVFPSMGWIIVDIVLNTLTAAFFLHSSIRLRRLDKRSLATAAA